MLTRPNLVQGLRIVRNHISMFGLWSAVLKAVAYILERLSFGWDTFDKKHGTDTQTWVKPEQADLPEEFRRDAVLYIPTARAAARHVLRNLPIRYEDFELVDLGCGKGRLILLASDYPFERITGIELSPLLAGIAASNVEKYMQKPPRSQKCRHVEVQCANAIDFAIPDSNIVFFLYNPFTGAVFEKCMEHIHRSAAQTRRQVYLAYVYPWPCQGWLQESEYFSLVAEYQVIDPRWSWSLWKHV